MISVLIPTYNYDVTELVKTVKQQCDKLNINYEIIVCDDASSDLTTIDANNIINHWQNCHYSVLRKNIGRSAIRNLLAEKATYNWLLFLDADTIPVSENFVRNYLQFLNNETKIVYGGIRYQQKQPDYRQLLRWIYGNGREALTVEKRNTAPHLSLLTLNFCIRKEIFDSVRFNENIPNLRHEDTLFSFDLSKSNIKVQHIDNNICHLGIESSALFLKKSEEAVVGLKFLIDNKLIDTSYINIAKTYRFLKKTGLRYPAFLFYKTTASVFRKNLLGKNPSLLIFDLYRLGYMCTL